MESTGILTPDSAASVGWHDTNNVKADDGNTAWIDIAPGADSGGIYVSDFDADIPAGAVIKGLVAGIKRSALYDGAVKDAQVQLYYDGGFKGDDKASSDYWPASLATKTYGGVSDTWGLALTDTIINNSALTLFLKAHNHYGYLSLAYVDFMYIDVYYETWAHKACGIAMPSKVMGLSRSILKKFIGVG